MAATERLALRRFGSVVAAALSLPGAMPSVARAETAPEQGSVSLKYLYYKDFQETRVTYPNEPRPAGERFDRITLWHHNFLPIQAVLFSRRLYERHGGFAEDMDQLEDWNLWTRFTLEVNEALCGVRGADRDGIKVGPGSPDGEAYSDLQRYIRDLKERGIVLAVCSKNNEDDARAPFRETRGMVLRLEDFAVFLANWDD